MNFVKVYLETLPIPMGLVLGYDIGETKLWSRKATLTEIGEDLLSTLIWPITGWPAIRRVSQRWDSRPLDY